MKTLLWNGIMIYLLSIQEMSLFNHLKSQHNNNYNYENIIFLPDPINPKSKFEILEKYNMNNFNIIIAFPKLYNIVNDFIDICNKIGKVELLPKLEKIPQLIIRDIVNLNSLYFI